MADPVNFLIGRGETLIRPIELLSGGGAKAHPYTFEEAYSRLRPELQVLDRSLSELPQLACPNDEAVVALTLHPTYLAKSYHPTRLINRLGLRQVGSRERRVLPSKWTTKEAPSEALVAPQLFVAGSRERLRHLGDAVLRSGDAGVQDDFRKIEHVDPLGVDRLKPIRGSDANPPLEVVLHANTTQAWGEDVLVGFQAWCAELGVSPHFAQRQQIGGLSFIGMRADRHALSDIAQFAFLRAIRRMPQLTVRDVESRTIHSGFTFPAQRSDTPPIDTELRVAVFDGGLPDRHPFPKYVVARDAPGVGKPVTDLVRHGTQVTSALLYGPLDRDEAVARPFAGLDHWRVLDENGDDFELMSALDRIMDVLEQHHYDLVSLSLGPDEAMLDDDVHVWTSRLDQFAASGRTLVISAAGNNGEMDQASGLCRVQPAGDGVNVLAVGAADRSGKGWARAPYSARGPGRSPGLVKPDVLAFGGSHAEPFFAADGSGMALGVTGTSFAAPTAARLGVGLRALFGSQLTPMAVKGLLIHRAECGDHAQCEVGWGCLPSELDDLATCAPGEATIVYQGVLEPSRYRRFYLPVPLDGFTKMVEFRATFVAATDVDPEDAINYTRTGVGITFRPKTVGHPGYYQDGGEWRERSAHKSASFFGQTALFETEQRLRDDAQRWEAVLKASKRFRPTSLDQPVFDIEHLARANGQAAPRGEAVSYALILTIYEKGAANLYDRVIRSYTGRLQAMRPQVEIPIRTRGA